MGKIKGLIGLLVIAGGFYVAWSLIPPYFYNYQFQDDLDDVARRVSYMSIPDDDVKQMVIRKAQQEEITLKEDQIAITHNGATIGITVKYSIHVDMAVHPVDLAFTTNSFNKRI
ncbi:MAG TPA: hypothetical protein VJN64_01140 [Terriglobales bacterium]|nr:hypothetical protein [Terriglobales bacterium]